MNRTTGDALTDALGDMVVINLPERKDRRDEFSAQLARIGSSFEDPRVRLFAAIRPADNGGFPTIGTRGCFLSHLEVLREALARGADSVLICEDDLDFAPVMIATGADIFARVKDHPWDIFYGGFSRVPDGRPLDAAGDLLDVPGSEGIVCAHFIAFSRPAMQVLVPYLEAIIARPPGHPDGGPMHVDGAYSRFRNEHPELRTIAAVPELGYQRASLTDIHALGWRDRTPVVRQMLAFARKLRNRRARS